MKRMCTPWTMEIASFLLVWRYSWCSQQNEGDEFTTIAGTRVLRPSSISALFIRKAIDPSLETSLLAFSV